MNRPALVVLALAAVAALAYARPAAAYAPWSAPDEAPQDDPSPGVLGTLEQWTESLYNEVDHMPQAPTYINDANRRAALRTVMACEGTADAGGYAALYGSTAARPKTFTGFADHPRIAQRISATDQRWTTAAGAYQFMAVSPIPGGGSTRVNTWDRIKAKLNLPDFSPESQDRAALELFAEAGALADVDAGRIMDAFAKVRRQWASLPGANYEGQGMRSQSFVMAAYQLAGGGVA
jgi:muramidase (phage lysozyme)